MILQCLLLSCFPSPWSIILLNIYKILPIRDAFFPLQDGLTQTCSMIPPTTALPILEYSPDGESSSHKLLN